MNTWRDYMGLWQLVVALPLLLTFGSCSKSVSGDFADDEDLYGGGVADSRLDVVTRDGGSNGDIAYPVRVFVFNAEDECVNAQTIQEGSDVFSMELPAGRYTVLAVGDADDERYELPTMSTATPDFEIRTQNGKLVDDMMTANSTVTLQKGVTSQLTLNMERKVMQMVSATINGLPTTATAVSLAISPLYEYVTLDGTLGGDEGSYELALAQQSDGETWKATPPNAFMYPSYGKPSFTVTVTIGSETKSYIYSCNEELPANYRLQVVGNYTNNGVQLSGIINGINWAGTKTITFDFDEESSSGSVTTEENGEVNNGDDNSGNSGNNGSGSQNVSGQVPAVGTEYKGCYVLATSGNTATLLSLEGKKNVVKNTNTDQQSVQDLVQTELADWTTSENIDAVWRLPNNSEAELIGVAGNNNSDISNYLNAGFFFIHDDATIGHFYREYDVSGMSFHDNYQFGPAVYLLPVTTLTFE